MQMPPRSKRTTSRPRHRPTPARCMRVGSVLQQCPYRFCLNNAAASAALLVVSPSPRFAGTRTRRPMLLVSTQYCHAVAVHAPRLTRHLPWPRRRDSRCRSRSAHRGRVMVLPAGGYPPRLVPAVPDANLWVCGVVWSTRGAAGISTRVTQCLHVESARFQRTSAGNAVALLVSSPRSVLPKRAPAPFPACLSDV